MGNSSGKRATSFWGKVMTTGDEPMLPQPADDNAPMISGRGTKIIADARGAYLAGNLRVLIQMMNESQQLRFRKVLVQQILRQLEQHESIDEGTPAQDAISLLHHWLDFPGTSAAETVLSTL